MVNPQDVLSLFKKGASKKQIADSLRISRAKVAELLSIAIKEIKKA